MATLVLSTVGTLVGGPLGGALGALIGRTIDQTVLFRSKDREGPRLTDLAVQSSQYGSAFPQVHGRARVAGTVIWATDLQERSQREGGGKGRPGTTRYSYSVSFAVALASRPIASIGRIWAEGNLLRGADGTFTSATGFRLYHGHGDQSADPLIAAAEGPDSCPAYRGLAYAVFEDMALEEFGNRIPSLTFEVFGDDGAISLADVAAEATGVAIVANERFAITGVTLSGESRRDVLQSIATGFPLIVAEAGDGLQARLRETAVGVAVPLAFSSLLPRGEDGEGGAAIGRTRAARRTDALTLRYYEPERDYQPGLRRAGASATGRAAQIDVPVVISAGRAQQRADHLLRAERDALDRIELRTAVLDLDMLPGRLLTVEGVPGQWRVQRWQWSADGVDMGLVSHRSVTALAASIVDPGRSVNTPDDGIGPTRIALLDMPSPIDRPMVTSHIAVAVAGGSSGWRGAHVYRLEADGSLGEVLDFLRVSATLGDVIDATGPGTPLLRDDRNAITVRLVRDGPFALTNADDAALSRGANLAMVGKEAIQFARAEPLGDVMFRLSGLWRGRGGTEDRIGGHAAGEPFVLINETLGLVDPDQIGAGTEFGAAAQGRDDDLPVETHLASHGRALMPLSPVHGSWSDDGAGGVVLRWVRRSRSGFAWRDNLDVPLGEDSEAYRITIIADGVTIGEHVASAATMAISAADMAIYRAGTSEALLASVTQQGALGVSAALLIALPL